MNEFLKWMCENSSVVVGIACVIIVVILACIKFYKLPKSEQVRRVKVCLLSWVINAEKELGSGTGKAKLSAVYDKFINRYPLLSLFISFNQFSEWVDDALEDMDKILSSDNELKNILNSDDTIEEIYGEVSD